MRGDDRVTPSSVRMVFRAFVDGQVAFPGRAVRAGDPPIPVKIAVGAVGRTASARVALI
jgi:hypothetical protein